MEDKLVYNKSALPLVSKVEDGWRFLADRHKLIRGTIAKRFVTGQVVNRTRYVSGRRLIYYGTDFFSQVSSFFAYCRKNLIVDKLNFMKGKEEGKNGYIRKNPECAAWTTRKKNFFILPVKPPSLSLRLQLQISWQVLTGRAGSSDLGIRSRPWQVAKRIGCVWLSESLSLRHLAFQFYLSLSTNLLAESSLKISFWDETAGGSRGSTTT